MDEWEERYYPQFDESVRVEAAQMSAHYRLFYCLERTIRSLVSDSIEQEEGTNWWDSKRVPDELQKEVAGRIKRELDAGMTLRSDEPIDYTTFGELGEIIKVNWDIFGATFSSQRAVERVLSNLNMLRGPIAHFTMLAEDEILRLGSSVYATGSA